MERMTAQMSDLVELDGTTFVVAGVVGGPLFDPPSLGIEPSMISTACWRGYVCSYSVADEELTLVELMLGPHSRVAESEISSTTTLQGRRARRNKSMGTYVFDGLSFRIPFTGGLLVGHGFIRDLYVHMGFHPAWKYEDVRELLFTDGHVDAVQDRSAEMAEARRMIESGAAKDPDGDRNLASWIERTFTLDYSRSFPE